MRIKIKHMKIIYLFTSLVIAFSTICCKQEATTTDESASSDAQETSAAPVSSNANQNLAANMSWTFLTHQLFHHNVTVASGTVDQDTKKGHWMDFHDNGTYDYGIWGEKTYSGTWTYNDQTKLLELKPAGGEKASEWQVGHRDDNLILVGTATHGDNRYQVRWLRNENRPEKNTQ